MTTFKPRETLTEQVARHIENLIAFGQLRSGERIYESAMAKQMDVSHGSIREGLLLLEKRHLVQNVPRKGAFVTPLDEYFVRSLYEVLQLYLTHTGRKLVRQWQTADMDKLESLYQRMKGCHDNNDLLAFLELGIEYTQASLAYADNYFIISAIEDLWPSAKRCAFVAFQRGGNRVLEDNLAHVRESISAIKDRDEERLAAILAGYAEQQCQQVLDAIDSASATA
ncbi:GntR family transcriptional regulator [Marinobacter sp.]|jgi:DNA-binding GntR family transcriptional regulator|uniref:GntR family transcriptional regulator n=1 Tax=Marinobacter sp. TaxID=50741 RepID=UPI000C0FB8D0|nr:GntR family transcriptional regulator [Marinobacter sp.]MBP55480.1 GntR family transcriptional regulator [Marinobacter sp.]PHQ74005.1 MAG: GntR family transcriptional regulator [Marinobacter sp.]|tara:strand:- start:167 stop:841 length:675 start_codon:yes stop_codon:yes gene_type:complete